MSEVTKNGTANVEGKQVEIMHDEVVGECPPISVEKVSSMHTCECHGSECYPGTTTTLEVVSKKKIFTKKNMLIAGGVVAALAAVGVVGYFVIGGGKTNDNWSEDHGDVDTGELEVTSSDEI